MTWPKNWCQNSHTALWWRNICTFLGHNGKCQSQRMRLETVFFITEKCQLISCLQTSDQSHSTDRTTGDRSGVSVMEKTGDWTLCAWTFLWVHVGNVRLNKLVSRFCWKKKKKNYFPHVFPQRNEWRKLPHWVQTSWDHMINTFYLCNLLAIGQFCLQNRLSMVDKILHFFNGTGSLISLS